VVAAHTLLRLVFWDPCKRDQQFCLHLFFILEVNPANDTNSLRRYSTKFRFQTQLPSSDLLPPSPPPSVWSYKTAQCQFLPCFSPPNPPSLVALLFAPWVSRMAGGQFLFFSLGEFRAGPSLLRGSLRARMNEPKSLPQWLRFSLVSRTGECRGAPG